MACPQDIKSLRRMMLKTFFITCLLLINRCCCEESPFGIRAEITLSSNITFYTSITYTDQLNIHSDVDSCTSTTETEARHEIREPSWPFQACCSSWSLHQTPLEKLKDLHLSLYLGLLLMDQKKKKYSVARQTDRHWLLLVRMWPKFNLMIRSSCIGKCVWGWVLCFTPAYNG